MKKSTSLEIQPVSMLFDIHRDSVDAREISEYLTWAKELIAIFPNILIFHNASIDVSQLDLPTPNLIQVELDDLPIYQRREAIEKICESYLLNRKEDLVYKLPSYGIVVASKFELLSKARSLRDAAYYLWVDIGITRFLDMKSTEGENFLDIQELHRSAYFEVDLRRNLNPIQFVHGKGLLRIPNIGSSRRVIGTGSFLVKGDYVNQLNILVGNLFNDWIDKSLWDTEQVAMGHLIREIPNLSFHIKKRSSPTSFLESLAVTGFVRAKPRIWMKILLGSRY